MLKRQFPLRLCNTCRQDLLTLFRYGFSSPCLSRRPLRPKVYRDSATKAYVRHFSFSSAIRSIHEEDAANTEGEVNSRPALPSDPEGGTSQAQIGSEEEEAIGTSWSSSVRILRNDILTQVEEEGRQLLLETIRTIRDYGAHPIDVARVAFSHRRKGPTSSELSEEERLLFNQVVEAHELPGGDVVETARINELGVEEIVRQARISFGAHLPDHLLFEDELTVYRRLYGNPLSAAAKSFREEEDLDHEVDGESETEEVDGELLQEDSEGKLQLVSSDLSNIRELDDQTMQNSRGEDAENAPADEQYVEDLAQLPAVSAEEIARLVNGTVTDQDEPEDGDESEVEGTRMHPLTALGKWKKPQTIFLPQESFLTPIRKILRDFSNKHIDEMSERLFGGKGLPHSTSVASPRSAIPQEPIPIDPSQHSMGEMEANTYVAAIMPGTFTALTSILVEVRKRLGSEWIRSLLAMDGGPRILDAGAGGAGIVAMREVLKAEHEISTLNDKDEPAPLGKATVLTGSTALRHRASSFLENTTFLPRLPDYVHVRDNPTMSDSRPPPQRKQYDIILAPHSLWSLKEEWQRKQVVQNLWSLLSPNGGVLILLEKGQPRGFEVVAGARELLLDRFIQSPNVSSSEQIADLTDGIHKVPGMIIAPCTNHGKCPMYPVPGVSKGRKDFCSFEQRFIRPQFLQRILKAKDRNHEDIKFSYVAVRKGVDFRSDLDNSSILRQTATAADSAFAGYEDFADIPIPSSAPFPTSEQPSDTPLTPHSINTLALALPRLIYPPLKRRGHITFDVCTPAAQIERWVIPKSFSKVAYRDARKAQWGDLWALGAKTRTLKSVRSGVKKSKEERKEMKRVAKAERKEQTRQGAEMMEEDDEEKDLEDFALEEDDDMDEESVEMEDWEKEWEAELTSQSTGSRGRQSRDRPGRAENKFSKESSGRGSLRTASKAAAAQNAAKLRTTKKGGAYRRQKAMAL